MAILLRHPHLRFRLGASEARSEPYKLYGERALELATPPESKSIGRVKGSAREQDDTVRMSKAVVFDFDGTLADTEGFLRQIYGDIAREKGWEPLSKRTYRRLFTASIWEAARWARFRPWRLHHLVSESRTRLQARANEIKIFDGLKNVVNELHKSGYDIYMLSRNWQSTVQIVVDKNGLGDKVVVLEKPGFFTKHKSVKKLLVQKKYEKKQTWMVGDEVRDLYAAKRAGVPFIAVVWGFQDKKTLKAFKPAALAQKPQEILDIILKSKD
ncbi:HAD-IA family hydrolase [Candidatus Parcubacteria bacterium]|nr:HAD-IA family hydrolase [Candidatus Parcubacteria bacterium]